MKFGEAICALLAERGVDTVFGIPGVHTIELFRNQERHGLKVVVPRHEQGAGFMADGYSRITGKPGVCFLVTGPGLLNALTPIAQAWHDSRPMLIIASTVDSAEVGRHRGILHDTPDVAETLRPYTLFSKNISTIEEFHASLEEAYSRWAIERPRPVYIGIPIDVLASEVSLPHREVSASSTTVAPAPKDIENATRVLEMAESPVIIAGGGCRAYRDSLIRLAERLDAPVLPTANSKGILPEEHALSLDLSAPFDGTRELLQEADTVLALGTELSDVEYIFTGASPVTLQNLIRVDLDPSVSHPDQKLPTIRSDAGEFINTFLSALDETHNHTHSRRGAERASKAKQSWISARDSDPYREWVEALYRGLPDDVIVAVDSSQLAYQAHQFMPLPNGAAWMSPYGLGTLGPALPMAIGAAVANPERPVVAMAGDGSSLFTIAELATATSLNKQLTVIIWVNGGYKEIESSFERAGIPPVGVGVSAPDFPALVQGLGGEPVVVQDPSTLTTAIKRSIETPHLTVILVDSPQPLRLGADSSIQ